MSGPKRWQPRGLKERTGRFGSTRWRAIGLVGGLWLSQLALACDAGGEAQHGIPGGRDGNATGGSASAAAGSGGVVQTVDPGRKDLHRLNSTEYNATVEDVLGTALQPANASWRGGELDGFDNMASVLGIDEAQYQRYFEAAAALATEVMASSELRARFVSCNLSDSACANSCVQKAGLRLFRRPLEPDELRTYRGVFDSARAMGDDESAAFTLTLRALLSSAEFLYRIELDPMPESTEPHRLSSFELASRLSYFLWSSAPDQALLDAASSGSLDQPEALAANLDRLLDDPKSERFVANFAGQWLGARGVWSHPVSPKFYQWSPRVARAASQEMLLYFADFLRSERSWFEFPTADINYIDGELAILYGIPTDLTGSGTFERVEYGGDERAGFFGLAGFLALSSLDRRTSPSRRGRWIASNLLCTAPPPPPAMVPELEGDSAGAGGASETPDVRQRLEQHRRDPACAGCHALFDPYGLALEQYDAIGLYRTSYEEGAPVDATASLLPSQEHPEGQVLSGREGLARAVASDPNFGACLAKKLLTYGLGRTVTAGDEVHLERARREWLRSGDSPSIRRLIQALVATEAFRSRRGGG
ncbi:MAG TPA: DUF1592 domain-containing protein [Polyangiaceae bacterium]|nr:DUF1592 domain-containing protein [Polyangiaceae bacterium]